jgi:tetratricopeptide (TPR) repeat protein
MTDCEGDATSNNNAPSFFTTSDLLRTLNDAIKVPSQEVTLDGDDGNKCHNDSQCSSSQSSTTPRYSSSSRSSPSSSCFELQTRLPDGSTRRATESDLAAADLQAKLQQAAKQVASLQRDQERFAWAEHQRQAVGNPLYQAKQYQSAMDIYLTCLLSKPSEETSSCRHLKEFQTRVYLPVLNNLAQCTLQLGQYRKAEQFCSMGIHDDAMKDDGETRNLATANKDENHDGILQHRQQYAKLYYRRGKARRLQGHYTTSRQDLECAMQMLKPQETDIALHNDDDDTMNSESDQQQRLAIQREMVALQKSIQQAKQHRQQQQVAMQRLLTTTSTTAKAAKFKNTATFKNKAECVPPCMPSKRRAFSNLRAPDNATVPFRKENDTAVKTTRTFKDDDRDSVFMMLCSRPWFAVAVAVAAVTFAAGHFFFSW